MNKQTNLFINGLLYETEKIRTGQSFLYRQDGFESMIIEIQLKDRIDGSLLKKVFAKILPRYRYLTQKFVIDQGDFYLVPNNKPFTIRQSDQFLPLGGKEVNEHLMDIHYDENTLFIAYHHGICDGKGILPFVKTLVYYYMSSYYIKKINVPDVQLISSPIQKGEDAEPAVVSLMDEESTGMPTILKKGYSLPEAKSQTERMTFSYHSRIKIDNDSFLDFSKSIGATPAIAIALLFSEAIEKFQEKNDDSSPIVCNLVTDLRGALDANVRNTQKNCVGSLELPYADNNDTDYQHLAKEYRQIISDFKSPKNINRELRKILGLSDRLDTLPSFKEKQQFLSFYETLLSATYIFSYIGQINLGEAEEYIREIHTYTSGTRGLSIEMFSMKEAFFLDIMQSFSNTKYVSAFLQLLKEENIQVQVEPMREITIPKDVIQESLFLK